MSSTRASYERVPYVSHAYVESHPDRLAAYGKLFGIDTPDPSKARILEIGCAGGGNLLPIALRWPEARFVGVDIAQSHIDQATAHIEALGIENVELYRMDLADLDDAWGSFDYIVAHGIWTWLPPETRERMLPVVAQRLSPNGVAYVSYNVYPGWRMREMVRDTVRFQTAGLDDPETMLATSRDLLDFIATAAPADLQTPYHAWMRSEAANMARAEDSYLFHDYLEEHNTPVYFHEFAAVAQQAGLAYLADAHFSTMLPMHLPAEAQQRLSAYAGDLVRTEQMLDLLRGRMFRHSLLVREETPVHRTLNWRSVTGLRLAGSVDAKTPDPLVQAGFDLLREAWPGDLSFGDLLERAVGRVGTSNEEPERLGSALLEAFARGVVELRATPTPVGDPARPELFAWARRQLEAGKRRVTTTRHEYVDVREPLVAELLAFDGSPLDSPSEIAQRARDHALLV